MSNRNEVPLAEQNAEREDDRPIPSQTTTMTKKRFVEPEITYAVDVLEATTFFQQADSGIAP